jgi:hypothetical protein
MAIPLTRLLYFTINLLYVIQLNDIIDETALLCLIILAAFSGRRAGYIFHRRHTCREFSNAERFIHVQYVNEKVKLTNSCQTRNS